MILELIFRSTRLYSLLINKQDMSQAQENKIIKSISKDEITKTFNQLLIEYENKGLSIATKEEMLAKQKDQKLLSKTADYTVDKIVNGMASLQLSFGSVIGELAENLTDESAKLTELKKAIAVEQEHLQHLKKVRLIADALHILNQEQEEQIKTLRTKTTREKIELEQEVQKARKAWQQDQQELAIVMKEKEEEMMLERVKEEANYQYELERQRLIENDDYEADKRLQQRELSDLAMQKHKTWVEREQYLADNQPELIKNKEKISEFEAKLKEEYNKAKGSAIKEADNKYKVLAELEEKEWSAIETGYQLKIESLSIVINQQIEQITEINSQLQEVNAQAQNLAMQAFQS